MSIWDSLNSDGTLNNSKSSTPSFGKTRRDMSNLSDSGRSVSGKLEDMQGQMTAMRQQLMAVEDNVTGVVKASSAQSTETAKYKDIWDLKQQFTQLASKSDSERTELMDRINHMATFLDSMSSSQASQKEAFESFAINLRNQVESGVLAREQATNAIPVVTVSADPQSLENSMFTDMDPFIADMARRAGIGVEDLQEIALKITEVNKSDEIAGLQLAHVEKVNEQLKEISLRKMEGNQVHEQQKLINTLQQQDHDKAIRLAEINAELDAEKITATCDKDVRNNRDVEISRARWDTMTAVSDQWSKAVTTAIRWGSVGGGVSFVAYCCVQIAQVYFN